METTDKSLLWLAAMLPLLFVPTSAAANGEPSPFPHDLLRHLLAKDRDGCLRRSACLVATNKETALPGLFRDSADLTSWTLPSRLTAARPDPRGLVVIECGPGHLTFHADGPWTRLLRVQFRTGSRARRWLDYSTYRQPAPTPPDRSFAGINKTKRRVQTDPVKSRKTRKSGQGLPHIAETPDNDVQGPNPREDPDVISFDSEDERSDSILPRTSRSAPSDDQEREVENLEPSSSEELRKIASLRRTSSLVPSGERNNAVPNTRTTIAFRKPRQVSGDMDPEGAFVVTVSHAHQGSTDHEAEPSPEEAIFVAEGREIEVVASPAGEIHLAGLKGFRQAYRLGLGGPRACRGTYPECRQRDRVLMNFAEKFFF